MNNKNITITLNRLFMDFAENKFENRGNWPSKVNLILEFSDYINNINKRQMRRFAPKGAKISLKALKKAANAGIDLWLKENMKTMMIDVF